MSGAAGGSSVPAQEAIAEAKRAVRSLRIALAMCALVLLLVALIAGLLSWQAVYAREQRYMLSLAEVTGRSLDAYFQSLETGLHGLRREIADGAGQIDTASLAPAVKRFKETYPDLGLLLVTRNDGQVVASSAGAGPGQFPSFSRVPSFARSFAELQAGSTLSVGPPLRSAFSGDWVIPLRYGARDAQGNIAFILSVSLPTSRPQSFWKDVPLPDNAALSLIHKEGFVVSRYPVPPNVQLEDVFQRPVSDHVQAFHREHSGERSGWFEGVSPITRALSMVAFQRLVHYPLTVQVVNPKRNAWRDWSRDTQVVFVLVAALVLTLVGALIYRWAVRRQVAWELERAQRLLELTRAHRELEDFTYTVSHDLRAPLRAVDGYAAILRGELGADLPPEQAHALGKIRDSAQRMGQLIDGLLAFARRSRQDIVKRDIDTAALVREVLRELMPESRVEIRLGPLPACRADPQALRQVWSSLISNALKFGTGATMPCIEIGHAPEAVPALAAGEAAPGGPAGAYFVRDNGAGFDMAHARSLFGVFSHTNSAGEYDGSGVGLATVKRIVERHGGQLWAESAPGRGATFYFTMGPR